ncbi:mitochondrial 37S ribosomal protein rsm10 [Lambiella insularis]|nr:mitochondrial 37S ribosomal protein rsm10 [Lambiella insularis]
MSLRDPSQKMSKSHDDPRSKILLTDSPEDIRLKFKHALTDSIAGVSFAPAERPGVSNLLQIWSHIDDKGRSAQELAEECTTLGMRAFKGLVADEVSKSLSGFRERYQTLTEGKSDLQLEEVAFNGARKARESARLTMQKVRDAVGIGRGSENREFPC